MATTELPTALPFLALLLSSCLSAYKYRARGRSNIPQQLLCTLTASAQGPVPGALNALGGVAGAVPC